MTRTDLLPYVAHYLDDAGAIRSPRDYWNGHLARYTARLAHIESQIAALAGKEGAS